MVEDGGRVMGMVTDRDLFIAVGTRDRKAADITIGEVIHGEVAARRPADNLDVALKTMADKKAHRLPVVDDGGKLQGILSIDDIVAQAETDSISGAVLQTLKTISTGPAAAVASPSARNAAA